MVPLLPLPSPSSLPSSTPKRNQLPPLTTHRQNRSKPPNSAAQTKPTRAARRPSAARRSRTSTACWRRRRAGRCRRRLSVRFGSVSCFLPYIPPGESGARGPMTDGADRSAAVRGLRRADFRGAEVGDGVFRVGFSGGVDLGILAWRFWESLMLGFKQKCSLITGSNGRERDIQVEHATLPWSEEETSEAISRRNTTRFSPRCRLIHQAGLAIYTCTLLSMRAKYDILPQRSNPL